MVTLHRAEMKQFTGRTRKGHQDTGTQVQSTLKGQILFDGTLSFALFFTAERKMAQSWVFVTTKFDMTF